MLADIRLLACSTISTPGDSTQNRRLSSREGAPTSCRWLPRSLFSKHRQTRCRFSQLSLMAPSERFPHGDGIQAATWPRWKGDPASRPKSWRPSSSGPDLRVSLPGWRFTNAMPAIWTGSDRTGPFGAWPTPIQSGSFPSTPRSSHTLSRRLRAAFSATTRVRFVSSRKMRRQVRWSMDAWSVWVELPASS